MIRTRHLAAMFRTVLRCLYLATAYSAKNGDAMVSLGVHGGGVLRSQHAEALLGARGAFGVISPILVPGHLVPAYGAAYDGPVRLSSCFLGAFTRAVFATATGWHKHLAAMSTRTLCQFAWVTFVLHLRAPRRPPNVPRFVVAVVIDAIKGVLLSGASAYIGQERRVRVLPLLANADASGTVPFPSFGVRVTAPGLNSDPASVFRGPAPNPAFSVSFIQ